MTVTRVMGKMLTVMKKAMTLMTQVTKKVMIQMGRKRKVLPILNQLSRRKMGMEKRKLKQVKREPEMESSRNLNLQEKTPGNLETSLENLDLQPWEEVVRRKMMVERR